MRARKQVTYKLEEPVGPTMARLGSKPPELPKLRLWKRCQKCDHAVYGYGIYCTQCGEKA